MSSQDGYDAAAAAGTRSLCSLLQCRYTTWVESVGSHRRLSAIILRDVGRYGRAVLFRGAPFSPLPLLLHLCTHGRTLALATDILISSPLLLTDHSSDAHCLPQALWFYLVTPHADKVRCMCAKTTLSETIRRN